MTGLRGTARGSSSAFARGRVKHSFSRQHFRTAHDFAEEALKIEQNNVEGTSDEQIKSMHRSYVTGAIISAVAGLESSINELYLEALDRNQTALQGLTENDFDVLGEMWDEIERTSVLRKYQMALLLTGNNGFDKGTAPFQDADSLVKLRNALVHYKPEWDYEQRVHEDLQTRLDSKFGLNPFSQNNALWFPHQCLGSGCARWAFEISKAFLEEFTNRMGIPQRI